MRPPWTIVSGYGAVLAYTLLVLNDCRNRLPHKSPTSATRTHSASTEHTPAQPHSEHGEINRGELRASVVRAAELLPRAA